MFFRRKNQPDPAAAGSESGSSMNAHQAVGDDKAAKSGQDDGGDEALEPVATAGSTENIDYPTGMTLFLLMTSVFVSMFLVALVRLRPPAPVAPRANLVPRTD